MTGLRRRVAVFIDYQNCYGWARRAFFADGDPQTHGHFNPKRLAETLAAKAPGREVVYVGVYCGLPDASKDPKTHSARRKQMARWQELGATVVARPLRYPHGWKPGSADKPIEKGVDVKLAIDAVMMGLRGEYDIAVVASCDTDLAPVVEALLSLGRDAVLEERVIETEIDSEGAVMETVAFERITERARTVEVEVIGWAGCTSRLAVKGEALVERWIGPLDFKAARDDAHYG